MTTSHDALTCPRRCRENAELEAGKAVGDAAPLLIAWLDELKLIVTAFRWTAKLRPSEARGEAKMWSILRDHESRGIAVRDGESERKVWRTTYAGSTRSRQQRVHNNLRRRGDAHARSRFYRFLVVAIAHRVKELRGSWPKYSGASGYGGKDVLRIQDWLYWTLCPWHPDDFQLGMAEPSARAPAGDGIVKRHGIVKCLKAVRGAEPTSLRDRLLARVKARAAYELLRMAEADLAALQESGGCDVSSELRAVREAMESLAPIVANGP